MFRLFASLALAAAVALPGAIVQIAVSTLLGAAMALPFGWNWQAGAVFAGVVNNGLAHIGRNVLRELKLDSNSEVSFPKPEGDYKVMFDGGEGHSIELDGKKIVQ